MGKKRGYTTGTRVQVTDAWRKAADRAIKEQYGSRAKFIEAMEERGREEFRKSAVNGTLQGRFDTSSLVLPMSKVLGIPAPPTRSLNELQDRLLRAANLLDDEHMLKLVIDAEFYLDPKKIS